MNESSDILIIGGGIVGLATAYQLTQQHPGRSVIVLEKELSVAQHQTGHNSGVLHSGLYYKPDSLKAVNCRTGRQAMIEFCARENIPVEICGKVVVATTNDDVPRLDELARRARANGLTGVRRIGPGELHELEPTFGIHGHTVHRKQIVEQ